MDKYPYHISGKREEDRAIKIFYLGVHEGHAGWGSEWFVNNAFNTLGHKTYCVDYRKNRHKLYKYFLNAPQNDVFLLQRGEYFPIPLIKSIGVPRFFWASELVSRCRDQDRLLKHNLFDHIFLHSNKCREAVVSWGWVDPKRCSVLLNGFDESLFRPIPNIQKDIDILFIGTITTRRKEILNRLKSQFNVLIASAFGEEMVRLFNRAKIVLNIHAEDVLDTETRVFEVLGCGAFLLTERLSPENPFSRNELVEFDTTEELCNKLQYFLNHDDDRNKIAGHGYAAAFSGHTYIHRAQEIIRIMSAYVGSMDKESDKTIKRNWQFCAYGMSEPFLRLGKNISERAGYAASMIRNLISMAAKRN
ncbi:MAG: glycosyltransferase family 1 protein [Nitrospinae bacterium]|nr:glycosyltransferase family 1 protein [Nitrospinota bacterium]MBI3813121.1 glycosyltransferase family 1 protein [Nitrospinota bacterium]